MSDEWRNKVDQYEQAMIAIGESASEDGYIKWVPSGQERNRARTAFKSALIQKALDHQDLRQFHHVQIADAPSLTETMVKSKILDKMIATDARTIPFYDSTNRRDEETDNIVMLWNLVIDEFSAEGNTDEERSVQTEARRRLFKQESLEQVSQLLVQLFTYHMMKDKGDVMLSGIPNDDQLPKFEMGVNHICRHPVWTAPLDRDAQMLAVGAALSKNQGGRAAFEGVALKFSYVLLGNKDDEFKKYWIGG